MMGSRAKMNLALPNFSLKQHGGEMIMRLGKLIIIHDNHNFLIVNITIFIIMTVKSSLSLSSNIHPQIYLNLFTYVYVATVSLDHFKICYSKPRNKSPGFHYNFGYAYTYVYVFIV